LGLATTVHGAVLEQYDLIAEGRALEGLVHLILASSRRSQAETVTQCACFLMSRIGSGGRRRASSPRGGSGGGGGGGGDGDDCRRGVVGFVVVARDVVRDPGGGEIQAGISLLD